MAERIRTIGWGIDPITVCLTNRPLISLSLGVCLFVHGVNGLWSHFYDSYKNEMEERIQENSGKYYIDRKSQCHMGLKTP